MTRSHCSIWRPAGVPGRIDPREIRSRLHGRAKLAYASNPMAIGGLIFDFDGLILDTETVEFQAWRELYSEHGCELPLDVWADCIGRPHGYFDPYAHLAGVSGKPIDRESVRIRRRQRCRELILLQSVRPGILQYLADARELGLRCAIASSSTHQWVGQHLDRLGIRHLFGAIICAEDTAQHKPAPDPYLHALEMLKLQPSQAIALEDSPNGIAAAAAAGIFTLAIPNSVTSRLDLSRAHHTIDSLEALPLACLIAMAEQYHASQPISRSNGCLARP